MIQPTQQNILRSLTTLCKLSPSVRFGQLLANLGFLAEDLYDRTLWDIEDAELLQVIEKHRTERVLSGAKRRPSLRSSDTASPLRPLGVSRTSRAPPTRGCRSTPTR